jgi:hypothetical protein
MQHRTAAPRKPAVLARLPQPFRFLVPETSDHVRTYSGLRTRRASYRTTWRTIVTESGICCFVAPLLADTVAESMPALALLVAAILRMLLPDPGAGRLVGVKAPETPLGSPVMDKATAALNPPLTVTVTVMLWFDPVLTERELAERAA